MKKPLTICLMLFGVVAQAQNFAITATTEAAVRKNIVKGNAANYGLGVINDTLKLIGLTTRNVIFTGSISKSGIGLGNVDNTSDANKPVSTATQTALSLKANLASPAFTGTITGITKTMVGLGNVDNTTDVSKPISTATQTALDLKLTSTSAASTYLPISNPTATGTLTAPTIANSLGATFATSSGSVGVGIVSAIEKLDVFSAGATAIKVGSSVNANFRGLKIGDASLSYSSFLQRLDTGELKIEAGFTSWGGFQTFYTNGSERMRIYTNGRIGINTTTDAGYLLDVNGTARFVNGVNLATTSGNVGIGTTAPQSSLHNYGQFTTGLALIGNPSNLQLITIGTPFSGKLLFGTDGSGYKFSIGKNQAGTVTDLITVNDNGNVGIGTTAPTSKLQVIDLPVYATNAAAVTAGLTAGAFYRTSVGVLMVVY